MVPGAVLSVVVSAAASGAVSERLGTGRAHATALVASLGVILAVTLTPLGGVLDLDAPGAGACDFSRLGFASLSTYLDLNDTSLNVALFVPLGLTIALLPGLRARLGLAVAAALLPFAIEATQLVVAALGRGCESADVVDNLSGLALGLILGFGASVIRDRTRRPGALIPRSGRG